MRPSALGFLRYRFHQVKGIDVEDQRDDVLHGSSPSSGPWTSGTGAGGTRGRRLQSILICTDELPQRPPCRIVKRRNLADCHRDVMGEGMRGVCKGGALSKEGPLISSAADCESEHLAE